MLTITDKQKEIINAYFSLVKKYPKQRITGEMLADKAGIRRQNIFSGKHFTNWADLFNTIHHMIDDPCLEALDEYLLQQHQKNPIEFFAKKILPLLYAQRDLLRILYGTDFDSSWIPFLQNSYTPRMAELLANSSEKLGFSTDFLAEMTINNILFIVKNWLTAEQVEDPIDFAPKFIKLMSYSEKDLLS